MARPTTIHVASGVSIVRRVYASGNGKRHCEKWTARIRLDGRRVDWPTGRRDAKAAGAAALRRRDQLERRAEGLEDFGEEGREPIGELVAEWRRVLDGRRIVDAARLEGKVRELLAPVRWLGEATTPVLRERLDHVAKTATHSIRKRKGLSPQTKNKYRGALSQFFTWLVAEGRWPANPVDGIPLAVVSGATYERHGLTLEELVRLVRVAPIDRGACYLLAAATGFRRAELKRVLWGHLDAERAVLKLAASSSKRRRREGQVLPPVVVEQLLALRAARMRGECPSPRRANPRPGWGDDTPIVCPPRLRTVRQDLEAAGIQWRDQGQGVVDLHSLRGTLATALADLGIPLTTAQALMRHSDPRLTANVYTTVGDPRLHAAVGVLDGALRELLGPNASQPSAAPATDPRANGTRRAPRPQSTTTKRVKTATPSRPAKGRKRASTA